MKQTTPVFTAFDWRAQNETQPDGIKNEWIAFHERHGVLVHDPSFSTLSRRLRLLRKSVARECVTFFVVGYVDPKKADEALQKSPEPVAWTKPFGVSDAYPQLYVTGSSVSAPAPVPPGETLHAFAVRYGLKTTEVLMKLLSLGVIGIHINSVLTAEQLQLLELEYANRNNPFVPGSAPQPGFRPRVGWRPGSRGGTVD